MVWLISSTLMIGAIIGFVSLSNAEWFCGVARQVAHGLLSIVCFALVGVTFLRFGWKIGVVDLALVFIVSNASLSFCRYFRKRSGL